MFITTANSLSGIPRPLLDRMEVIQIPGYTLDEKIQIARRYRVPRQLRDHGLEQRLELTDDALRRIVTEYTREAGVRNLTGSSPGGSQGARSLEEPWEGVRQVGVDEVRELLGCPYRDERPEGAQVGLHGWPGLRSAASPWTSRRWPSPARATSRSPVSSATS